MDVVVILGYSARTWNESWCDISGRRSELIIVIKLSEQVMLLASWGMNIMVSIFTLLRECYDINFEIGPVMWYVWKLFWHYLITMKGCSGSAPNFGLRFQSPAHLHAYMPISDNEHLNAWNSLSSHCYNTFILPWCNIVYCSLEVFSRLLDGGRFLIGLKIRMNELDQAIKVFGSDLISRQQLAWWYRL